MILRLLHIFFWLSLIWGCTKEAEDDLFIPDFEVFVLLPAEGLGDRSFVDAIYEGVETAGTDFRFRANYIVPDTYEEGEKWLAELPYLKSVESLPSLVIVAGNQYTASVNLLKGNFKGHKVLLFAGSAEPYEGVASIVYRSYAPSYIAGFLSSRLIEGCRAVTIAAFDATFLSEYQAGFTDGVEDAGGTVSETLFLSDDFRGFAMPDSAYRVALATLAEHHLIFGLATGSNFGIINAARSFRENRYVIGIDADQSWMGLNVVTGSVVQHFHLDIYEYIEQFSHGKFISGNFTRSMADGKTGFLINPLVLGNSDIPATLVDTAISKEKTFIDTN